MVFNIAKILGEKKIREQDINRGKIARKNENNRKDLKIQQGNKKKKDISKQTQNNRSKNIKIVREKFRRKKQRNDNREKGM